MPLLLSLFHHRTPTSASISIANIVFLGIVASSNKLWIRVTRRRRLQQNTAFITHVRHQVSVRISGNTCIYLFSTSGLTYCISENLKLHMASAQCKHMFCAAGLPRYHATLDHHLAQTEKVTIVTGFVVDQNIRRLGLRTVSFAKVFKVSSTTVLRVDGHCP